MKKVEKIYLIISDTTSRMAAQYGEFNKINVLKKKQKKIKPFKVIPIEA